MKYIGIMKSMLKRIKFEEEIVDLVKGVVVVVFFDILRCFLVCIDDGGGIFVLVGFNGSICSVDFVGVNDIFNFIFFCFKFLSVLVN